MGGPIHRHRVPGPERRTATRRFTTRARAGREANLRRRGRKAARSLLVPLRAGQGTGDIPERRRTHPVAIAPAHAERTELPRPRRADQPPRHRLAGDPRRRAGTVPGHGDLRLSHDRYFSTVSPTAWSRSAKAKCTATREGYSDWRRSAFQPAACAVSTAAALVSTLRAFGPRFQRVSKDLPMRKLTC